MDYWSSPARWPGPAGLGACPIMKKSLLLLVLAAGCARFAAGAESGPLFAPEPPDPGAAALVETYLPLLAAGEYSQALTLNDLRGMRQYFLERRLAELKRKNPELTAQDLEEMSAQIQLNDLNPARLQEILLGVMQEANFAGMQWRIRGYAAAPEPIEGHLVSIETRTAEGRERPLLLGIKKLGDQWLVAPEVVEAMAARMATVRALPKAAVPPELLALITTFWTHWQSGELNEAYALAGPAYRQRVSLLAFLQQAQDFIAAAGVPAGWDVVQGVESAPGVLWLGVTIQGSKASKPTLMSFRRAGETWMLEDIQLQPPRNGPPPGVAPGAAAPFRQNLRPDLKPVIGPAAPPPVSDPEPPPASTRPAPAQPDAPAGPDAL
jgi:hypothetical protein